MFPVVDEIGDLPVTKDVSAALKAGVCAGFLGFRLRVFGFRMSGFGYDGFRVRGLGFRV